MKQVTFICGGELVPASRFRVHPIAAALAEEGWATEVIHGYGPADHNIANPRLRSAYRLACRFRRAVRTALLKRDGPIVIQRLALPLLGLPEVILARKNGRLVFDFDDAVFLSRQAWQTRLRRYAIDSICNAAAHVVVGNSWLADSVPTRSPVSVIPTCIDTTVYRPAKDRDANSTLRVGWVGTGGNFRHLRQLAAPLAALRTEGYPFEFVICSDERNEALFDELGARFVKWRPDEELAFLQSLDIGLMPLTDDVWCKGKCSFKMIQYMAVGCPVVASAIGMNNDVLRGGIGGMLVPDGNWEDPLRQLLASREKREQCGFDARWRAVEGYDLTVAVNRYREILQDLQ